MVQHSLTGHAWLAIIATSLAVVSCVSDAQYRHEADQAYSVLKARQDSLQSIYHLDRYAHYDWDQGRRQIVFSDSGIARVVASVQFVGDVSTKSNTWLWAWDNPSIDTGLTHIARQVRSYGIRHRIGRLVHATWPATEEDGWEMTAFAVQVSNARGAYRSPSDDGPLFMVLTDVRWATRTDTVVHGERAQ